MAKQGEIDYLRKGGESFVRHGMGKPFTNAACPVQLMQIGAVMALLPAPPGRLLDVGCGAGWTSSFFARRGYSVVGVDISADMIELAGGRAKGEGLTNAQFVVCDYENMLFEEEFDCAVFYDSLHHSIDEEEALRKVFKALKPGGICVTSEPGKGHAKSESSVRAVANFDVTERDMPPGQIIRAAKKAGFQKCIVYPHAKELGIATYAYTGNWLKSWAARWQWVRKMGAMLQGLRTLLYRWRSSGIVVLIK